MNKDSTRKDTNSNLINNIYWERVNLYIEGTIDSSLLQEECQVSLINNKRRIPLEFLEIDNEGNFIVWINVVSVDKNYPLNNGVWRLVLVRKGHTGEIKFKINDNISKGNFSKIFKYGKNRYIVYPVTDVNGNVTIEVMNYESSYKCRKKITYKRFKKGLRNFVFKVLFNIFKLFKQKNNWVLFASDSRDHISGNLKFVRDRMVQRGLDYELKYLFKANISNYRSVKDKFKLPFYLAMSKYIFIDDFYPLIYKIKLRKSTELIQLWHAVGAFKTFGYSRVGKVGGPSPFSSNHRNYTKAIVSSSEIAKYYAEGFGIGRNKIYATGIPRTDVFYDKNYRDETIEKIYEKYPQLKGKKVITFAPTFRGKGAKSAYYDFDRVDMDKLYEYCRKNNSMLLFKMHPFVNMQEIPEEKSDLFIDMSSYREINDLLLITDVLITDYSSTVFEFSLLNRPMLFYAYDLEEYIATRDFYFDYEDFVPGKICRTFDELLDSMENEDYQFYKVKEFRGRFFEHTDGKSTDRVIDLVFGGEKQRSKP